MTEQQNKGKMLIFIATDITAEPFAKRAADFTKKVIKSNMNQEAREKVTSEPSTI